MKNKLTIIKLIDFIGVILFVFSFMLFCYDKIEIKYICLLFLVSTLLMLPDSIMFIVKSTKESNWFGSYWFTKFFGLIIAIIIFLIGFIFCLNK